MFRKSQSTKKSKGLSYWFLALSILILAGAAIWTGYLGQQTLGFSKESSLISLQNPLFKDYLLELGVEPSGKPLLRNSTAEQEAPAIIPLGNPIAAAKERALPKEPLVAKADELESASLQKIFSNLRGFENKRAELLLKQIKPTVAQVQKGSLAEAWGFKSGDQLKMVGIQPISSVWDYYQSVDSISLEQLSFSILRGKKQIRIADIAPKQNFSVNQVGLLFVIPKDVSYISRADEAILAAQFDEQFIKAVGFGFRKSYIESLTAFSLGLVDLTLNQGFDLARYEKINTAGVLKWHHDKFLEKIEMFYSEKGSHMSKQELLMGAFQQALFGFFAAFILFVSAYVIRLKSLSAEGLER
jgi:hypothetical protein